MVLKEPCDTDSPMNFPRPLIFTVLQHMGKPSNTKGCVLFVLIISFSENNHFCFIDNLCVPVGEQKFLISKHGVRDQMPTEPFFYSSYRETPLLFNFTYREYGPEDRKRGLTVYIKNSAMMFARIGSHNMMHQLHDEVLPMIATAAGIDELQQSAWPGDESLLLIAMDGFNTKRAPRGPLEVLGEAMEIQQIPFKVLGRLSHHKLKHICFEKAYVGLQTSTTWYHYGFRQMQGPIEGMDAEAVGRNAKLVTKWLVEQVRAQAKKPVFFTPEESQKPFITVVSRSQSRRMLNEAEFVADLQRAFPNTIVKVIDENKHSFLELVETMSRSVALVGMHGAMMIMAMFLEPKSAVIEMFPFGIPADNYAPYKTLASLPHFDLYYRSWVNPFEEEPYNRGHPDWIRIYGGLKHLPASYAAGIRATKTVPKHKCCTSSFWLYRIYQDTWIDSNVIINLLRQSEQKALQK